MKHRDWKILVKALPKGLTVSEAKDIVGADFSTVRLALIRHGYKAKDGRVGNDKSSQRVIDPKKVNWKLSNVELGRRYGVSRERFRQLREREGKPRVESRGGYHPKKVNNIVDNGRRVSKVAA